MGSRQTIYKWLSNLNEDDSRREIECIAARLLIPFAPPSGTTKDLVSWLETMDMANGYTENIDFAARVVMNVAKSEFPSQ